MLYLELLKSTYGFPQYYADCEFNRMHDDGDPVKRYKDEVRGVIPLVCDVIVHGREEMPERDNLIAIEMKKTGRPADETLANQRRLRALTMPLYKRTGPQGEPSAFAGYVSGYELGILIVLDPAHVRFRVEEYRSGALVQAECGSF